MRNRRFLPALGLAALVALPASAAQQLEIHLAGMQVIASDPAKRDQPVVDEVWVLAVADHPSAPHLLRPPHRTSLMLGCDARGAACEQVLAVDGMDLELRSPTDGVAITPAFRNGIFRFGVDLGYGDLDHGLLEPQSGRRDERISSRLRLLGGTLDVDRTNGVCSYVLAPIGGVIGKLVPRAFFAGAALSTSIPDEGAWIELVDRRTGASVGSVSIAGRADGTVDREEVVHVWYSHEPDLEHQPRNLRHYVLLSVLGDGVDDSARIPVIEGVCPLPATPSTGSCPPAQYP